MLPELSIVKVDTRHYRTIARENWGLTKEQMEGRHVHHRIPVSRGGTDDPSNLYVCTEKYHDIVWHGGDGGFIGLASAAGKIGGAKSLELCTGIHAPGMASAAGKMGGKKVVEEGLGIHAPGVITFETRSKGGKIGGKTQPRDAKVKGGKSSVDKGVGIHAPGMQSKGGKNQPRETKVQGGNTTASQKWMCLDTGHISNPGALTRWQKVRGIDTSLRVRVG